MTLVLWSGGFDSTLVLYDACVEAKKKDLAPVRAISINHEQVPANREHQKARQRIFVCMKKRGLAFDWAEVNISTWGTFKADGAAGMVQPGIWLPAAVPYLGPTEDLLTGWARGDDIFHYLNDICGAFEHHARLMGKTGLIQTPLEWTPKWEILRRLREARLVSLPWTCEEPKDWRACGKCQPCRDLKTARYRLRLEGG